jgi:hypothetical protein
MFGHSMLKVRVVDSLYDLYKDVVKDANESRLEGSKISLTELIRTVLVSQDKATLQVIATSIKNPSNKPFQLTKELKTLLDTNIGTMTDGDIANLTGLRISQVARYRVRNSLPKTGRKQVLTDVQKELLFKLAGKAVDTEVAAACGVSN